MAESRRARDAAALARARPWWIAWDVVGVLVFVAIGRGVHDHGAGAAGVASTAWPFLAGLAAGWWLVLARRWNGASVAVGTGIVLCTVAVGMTLRAATGQGTELAFIIVAVCFVGLFLVGPRWVVVRRRSRVGQRPAAHG